MVQKQFGIKYGKVKNKKISLVLVLKSRMKQSGAEGVLCTCLLSCHKAYCIALVCFEDTSYSCTFLVLKIQFCLFEVTLLDLMLFFLQSVSICHVCLPLTPTPEPFFFVVIQMLASQASSTRYNVFKHSFHILCHFL